MPTLEQFASTRYEDPLAQIDWSAMDRDCWWLPPQALSLCAVAQFEALPLKTRQCLSQLEYVHLLQAGLWLESQFMARMARLCAAVSTAFESYSGASSSCSRSFRPQAL